MKLIFVIITLVSLVFSNCYSIEKDSLEAIVQNSKQKIEKVNALLSLSKIVREENKELSIKYCKNAIKIAEDLDDKIYLISAYTKLGITYRKFGDFENSLKYFLEGLDIAEDVGNIEWKININNSLGSLYLNYYQNSNALKYYKKSLIFANQINDSLGICNAMNNIGIVFWRSNNLDSSVYYIQKSLIISRDLKDSVGLISSFNNLGLLHTELGNYERAFGYLNRSLRIAENLHDKWEMANILNNRASLCLKMEKFQFVEEDLDRAIRIAKEIQSKIFESDSYLIMSNYYSAVNKYEESLEYFKKYSELNTSLINEETSDKIAKIQKDFELKTKDRHLNKLSKTNDTQYLFILLLATSIVLLLIVIFIYILKLKENKRLTDELKKKNIDLETLSNGKSKFFTLISHDLKAPLYNISNLSNLLKLYQNDMDEVEKLETLDQLNISSKQLLILVDNILIWAQTQVGNIDNNPEKLNLKYLIRESIDILTPYANEKGIEIIDKSEEIHIEADENLLATSIRNLLSNAIKFSSMNSQVLIETKLVNNSIIINVIDSGMGIENDRIEEILAGNASSTLGTNKEKGSGLGIKISKEFIEMIGGSLTLKSELEQGTTFTINLPKKK